MIERAQEMVVSLPTEALYVDVDLIRMEQVLGNLLNNASKYTPRGSHLGHARGGDRGGAHSLDAVV